MPLLTANNVWAVPSGAIAINATTITLTAGQGARFPAIAAPNYMFATLFDASNDIEIVQITALAGDVLTVTRGVDGTIPRAWPATGVRIECRDCAAFLTSLKADLNALISAGGYTMTGALTLAADPAASDHLMTKGYADAHYLASNVNYQAPLGYDFIQTLSNTIGLGWTGAAISSQVDVTNTGNLWTTANYSPSSKAVAGAQCVWNTGVWENGSIYFPNNQTFDNGTPWVLAGWRWSGNPPTLVAQSVYLRNQ